MRRVLVLGLNHVTVAPSEPVIGSMLPRTDHSVPEGWVVVPLNETELTLTSSMRAVIPVKPVTTPASKLTISPMLVMACGFSCSSSAFIVPSHDSVRTAALADSKVQINAKATIRIRDIAMLCPGITPRHGADGVSLPSSPITAAEAGYSSATAGSSVLWSAFRRKNDAEQHPFVRAYLPRTPDRRTTIWRDHTVDLVIGTRRPFAVALDLVMVADHPALRRAAVHEVTAGASAVVSVELQVKVFMPPIVADPEISFLRRGAYTNRHEERAAEQRDEVAPPHHSITSSARANARVV